ncbi:conserved hypothetical protein [Geotrichum candidum]|uniref:Uncharacterized protein n=1 Tax=Geotrichum candidum TaxID=1173061 RepID=A0A0J9X5T7_GEOCN|nr:conserved hypothetical protein [Geotrichum candidum]
MSASRITKSYGKPLVIAAGTAVAAGLAYFLNSHFQILGASSGTNSGLDYYSNPNSALLGRASKDPEPVDTEINDEWTEDELRAWLEKRDVTAPEETSRQELLGLAKSIAHV